MAETSDTLASQPDLKVIAKAFKDQVEGLSETVPLTPVLTQLNEVLTDLLIKLPSLPKVANERVGSSSKPEEIRFLVVEDTPFWAEQVYDVISDLSQYYLGLYEFTIEIVDNVTEAVQKVRPRKRSHVIADDYSAVRTIAVLDICLPKTREHADSIKLAASNNSSSFETPSPVNGLALIRKLTEFEFNLPVIIFSTIDSIADRKKICGWGIPESCFVSKVLDLQNI